MKNLNELSQKEKEELERIFNMTQEDYYKYLHSILENSNIENSKNNNKKELKDV